MSQADARPQPPASALPFTAAITGGRSERTSVNTSINARASSRFSATEAVEIFFSDARSAPEQKSDPAPAMTTAVTRSSSLARRSALFRAEINSSLSALRLSGRLRVMRAKESDNSYSTVSAAAITPSSILRRQPQAICFLLIDFDLHAQKRSRKCLSLRIGHQRKRPAATQTLVQKKVQSAQIWQLESLNLAFANTAKVFFDPGGSYFAYEQGIEIFAQGDQPDIRSVALVARTGVRESG